MFFLFSLSLLWWSLRFPILIIVLRLEFFFVSCFFIKVEFGLPDLEGRAHILSIHSKSMNVDRDIRYELIARLCPNTTGAELRSVCTEAGMFAIRARKKSISEKDFLDAVNKVIKGYQKFSSTPKYMVYN